MSDQTLKAIQVYFRIGVGLLIVGTFVYLVIWRNHDGEMLIRVMLLLLGMDRLAMGILARFRE